MSPFRVITNFCSGTTTESAFPPLPSPSHSTNSYTSPCYFVSRSTPGSLCFTHSSSQVRSSYEYPSQTCFSSCHSPPSFIHTPNKFNVSSPNLTHHTSNLPSHIPKLDIELWENLPSQCCTPKNKLTLPDRSTEPTWERSRHIDAQLLTHKFGLGIQSSPTGHWRSHKHTHSQSHATSHTHATSHGRIHSHSQSHSHPTRHKLSQTKPSLFCGNTNRHKASGEDAQRAGIPLCYSFKYWDPRERPITLLGNVFDANSLGKWIYDWAVYRFGAGTPLADVAGDFWLLLIQLAGKVKCADSCLQKVRKERDHELIEEFLESGNRLWARFKLLLKSCEDCVKHSEASSIKAGNNWRKRAGISVVECMFDRDGELDRMEKLMSSIRLWGMRFDANCDEILRAALI